jgi:hypothetical protein
VGIVGGIFDQIFRRKKEVTSKDIRVALIGVKRDRKRKHMELRKLSSKRAEVIEKIKKCRRDGNSMEVDVLWEEIKQLRIDSAYAKREAKVLTLEAIGLTRYLKGLERLEKQNDQGKIKALLERVRTSGLDEKLRGVEIDEMAYKDALDATLEEVGLEIEDWEGDEEEDLEKAKFLAEIDAINMAEEAGKLDEALEKEQRLQKKLEDEKIAGLEGDADA